MDPITLLIVCPLVFLAMLVDAIAGGGGLISLTAYLVAGLPPHVALGTNKVSSAIGTVVATARFAKSGLIKIKLAIPAVIFALAGSAIGAKVALHTPDGVIQMIMVFALPVVAFFVLRKRALDVPADATISTKSRSPSSPFRRFSSACTTASTDRARARSCCSHSRRRRSCPCAKRTAK